MFCVGSWFFCVCCCLVVCGLFLFSVFGGVLCFVVCVFLLLSVFSGWLFFLVAFVLWVPVFVTLRGGARGLSFFFCKYDKK